MLFDEKLKKLILIIEINEQLPHAASLYKLHVSVIITHLDHTHLHHLVLH